MYKRFEDMFAKATGTRDPFPYQVRFANADEILHLVHAPTGAGKTATAILGWLWRRRFAPKQVQTMTPRRLVYCLPMRVLVEQTRACATTWLKNLSLHDEIKVHVLMGGVDTEEWFLDPERPAIFIGTQDMLLSRALNRGYAARRFHWPIDFGLLNNDCLWVFDEPQLMGSGVSTSAQLAGLRKAFDTFGPCPSVWMSATLEPSWLDTVDFKDRFQAEPLKLTADDYSDERLHKRMTATKTLHPLGAASSKDMKDVAKKVWEKHGETKESQTLVVLNTVERAKLVYAELDKLRKKSATPRLLLVHSRFRPAEREFLNEQLQDKGEHAIDRIIVATQVVEAGVDISAHALITELAPWASIVQRIGRCNRTGAEGPGQIYWIDVLSDEKAARPYTPVDLNFTRKQLAKLEGKSVSPQALDEFKRNEHITLPFEHKHVLRRRDLLDLFDTSPDLSGNDIDIQRFVRGDDPDTDVQVFWRDMSADDWDATPRRDEMCNVPVGSVKSFLKKDKIEGYLWDHIDGAWQEIRNPDREVRPGLTILVPATAGGYTELGWDTDSKAAVAPVGGQFVPEEPAGGDPNSARGGPALTIVQHTKNVAHELHTLLKEVSHLIPDWRDHLTKAAWWHDVGKAHAAFQIGMRSANPALDAGQLWAKSGTKARLRHGRKHFRHELASALATLQSGLPFRVAYLVATHHGRARLAIRSLPGEYEPENPETPFALGIFHDDPLPSVELGDGHSWEEGKLDLSPMRLGGETSWTGRALELLGALGPFKLAYLEAVLRAADVRASKKEATNV